MSEIVLAADGGNSKTDLALVSREGEALALVRGPRSTPQYLGVEGCLEVLGGLLAEALAGAGLDGSDRPVAEVAELLLAGVDFPADEQELEAAAARRGWARATNVENDTFAANTSSGAGNAIAQGGGTVAAANTILTRGFRPLPVGPRAGAGSRMGGFARGQAAEALGLGVRGPAAAPRPGRGGGPKRT